MTTQGTLYVADPWESKVLMRKEEQHYKRTPHIDLAMTYSISSMLESIPNVLSITGGVS